MSCIYTPLRYPGGKAKLAPFIKAVLEKNGLCDAHYVEPYAGGAGVGLSLLFTDYARHIYLNDISYPIYCFWDTVLNNVEYIARRIHDVRVTPVSWRKQKCILTSHKEHAPCEVGFALFFMNRTNRSGILNGGMIGGNDQSGKWKIDARFSRAALIKRIENIAEYRDRITIQNMDAMAFMQMMIRKLPRRSFIYLDPPYYENGSRLYTDYYQHADHECIAKYMHTGVSQPWIVTYDNVGEIRKLYSERRTVIFSLNYSANSHRKGTEVMVFCDSLKIPNGMVVR